MTQVDRSGVSTVATADGLGRVVSTRRGPTGLQQVVLHTFDADGRETTTTDANNHVTRRVFDGAGRAVRETRGLLASCIDPCPGREEVVSKYDAVGNLLEAKSLRPTGASFDVRNTWDDLNRNVRTENGEGNVTSKAYDAAGNVLCVKAPKGNGHQTHGWASGKTLAEVEGVACSGAYVTRYTWDEVGKQTSVQDANGSEWRFRYDRTRNLVAKLDANLHLTTYRYDARNQRTEELQHLGNNQTLPARDSLPVYVAPNAGFTTGTLRTQWTYDGNGQLEDEVDAKGQAKHHEYGLLKRLVTVTYSGHAAPRVLPSIDAIGYTYRGEGEVETCSETKTTPAGAVTEVTSHFYDGLERRTRTQRYDGYETTYGYDVKGNRTLVRDADGVSTAYTYDAVDRLKTATTPVGVATYDFFEDGLLKQTDYGNGLKETRTYDAAGRLETLSVDKVGQAVSRFDYGYDANGNRVSQVETRGLAGETTTYGYDEADRLIGVEYPAETHLYQVDAVGNRTGEKRAATGVVAALTVAAFAALSPAVASAAVERQHNAVDWVVAVNDVKASTTTALTYDANGNRTGDGTKAYRWDIRDTLTRVEDGAAVVGTYDYDAKLQRVKADTAQGHVEYVLDGKYVLREGGARSRRYHFGEGEALAVTGVGGAAGQDRWLLTDALGSVVTEADATATSVTARQFDAWGNYRNNTAPTANETRLGYTGHQFDVETGLTYARARYYDSKLGVFLSRDSFEGVLGDAPSLHRFTYAHNNPLRYADPSGRCIWQSCAEMLFGGEDAAEGPQPDAPVDVVAPKGNPGGMKLSEQAETEKTTKTMKSQEDRRQLLDNASLDESVMYDYGELLGGNSMARAWTGEDEMSRKLSRLERAENAFDATGKVVDAAFIVEGGAGFASLLEKEAASTAKNQARKQLFQKAETTVFEDAHALGGMTCPCFEAGTVVHTKSGAVAIEEVRVGDLVLSKDDKTGVVDYRPVVQLFVTPEKEVFELRLSDDSGAETVLGVTPGHPFWVKDIGWVGAANLASGIEVANSSGGWLRVTGATWHQKKTTVFNFEVEGFHTYFVGESAAWVHNVCSPGCKSVTTISASGEMIAGGDVSGGSGIGRVAGPPRAAGCKGSTGCGLLPGEGAPGSFDDLTAMGSVGDNLTPHHIPSNAYMKRAVPGYTRGEGVSIAMEHPVPGAGGRHRATSSYGVGDPDMSLNGRTTMAREVMDARRIYRQEGLYTPAVRSGLQDLVEQNKQRWFPFFEKK